MEGTWAEEKEDRQRIEPGMYTIGLKEERGGDVVI